MRCRVETPHVVNVLPLLIVAWFSSSLVSTQLTSTPGPPTAQASQAPADSSTLVSAFISGAASQVPVASSGLTLINGVGTVSTNAPAVSGSSNIAPIVSSMTLPALPPQSTNEAPCNNPEFEYRNNSNALGATIAPVGLPIFTVDQCLNYCVSTITCVGVDIDYRLNPVNCWVHSNPNDYVGIDAIFFQPGTALYRLITRCATTTTGASSTSSTTTATTTTTSTTPSTTTTRTSTTPSTTTTSGTLFPCINPEFQYRNNSNALGATIAPVPIFTVDQCLNYCAITVTCVGVDIDYPLNPVNCWVHSNPNDYVGDNAIFDQPGTALYRLITRCATTTTVASSTTTTATTTRTSTTTPTTTSTTTTPTTTTITSTTPITTLAPCNNPEFEYRNNSNALGATKAPIGLPIFTVEQCLNYCVSTITCVGVDIDYPLNPVNCWVHSNPNDYVGNNAIFDQPGTALYRLITRCATTTVSTSSTTTQSTSTPSTSTSTSTSSTTPTTTTTMTSRTSTTTPTTTTRTSTATPTTTSTTTTRTSTTTTQPTTTGCVSGWSQPIVSFSMANGQYQRSLTVSDCQLACTTTSGCIAIDIYQPDLSSSVVYCYLLFTATPLVPAPSFTHYDLIINPNCIPSSAATSATTTASSVNTCWLQALYGANADGGFILQSQVLSAIDCAALCVANYPICQAAEYEPVSQQCYGHTNTLNSQPNPCCTRFEYSCGYNAFCQDNLPSSFIAFSNTNLPTSTGFLQFGARTLALCTQACLSFSSPSTGLPCVRFTYNTRSSDPNTQCYLYTNGGDSNINNFAGSTLYLRKLCATIPISTTIPTVMPISPLSYCAMDLMIIIDSSGSVISSQVPGQPNNWGSIIQFVSSVIQSGTRVGFFFDRVAVITYSNIALTTFDFLNYTSTSSILAALNRTTVIGSTTNTPLALATGLSLFQAQGRPTATNIMLHVTDGHGLVDSSWFDAYFATIAQMESTTKIQRFAVGIVPSADRAELQAFVSPSGGLWLVNSYSALSSVVTDVVKGINSIGCVPGLSTTQSTTTSTSTTTTTPTTTTTSRSTSTTTTPTTTTTRSSSTSTPTTTTTTRLTTTFPSTTTPTPGVWQPAFGMAINQQLSNVNNIIVNFTVPLANSFGSFNTITARFSSTSLSWYYTEICSGMQAGTQAVLSTSGGFPSIYYSWRSTQQNGIESGCRSGVIQLSNNAGMSLVQLSGPAYSDDDRLTSWSTFGITNLMAFPNTMAYVVSSSQSYNSPGGTIPLDQVIVSPSDGRYNNAVFSYTCTDPGTYFFSMSVGVTSGSTAVVQLQLTAAATGQPLVLGEMLRQSTTSNDLTTLSRNVLTDCDRGDTVSVILVSGTVDRGTVTENLLSFIGFQYGLAGTSTTAAWSLFADSSWNAGSSNIDPLFFIGEEFSNIGVSYSPFSSTVTIFTSGYYYLYLSAGLEPNQPCRLSIRKADNSVVFAIRRTSNNQNRVDTIGHGAVVLLNANDQLRIVADAFTSGYSTADGRHTSFFGMLLIPTGTVPPQLPSSSSTTSTSTSTTTTPTTTTTTTTTTTRPPTTTTVVQTGAYQPAFGVALNQPLPSSDGQTVGFNVPLANFFGAYNFATSRFASNSLSFYFTEVCSGMRAGTQAVLSTSGGFPSIYYSWRSTQQNGIESGCRSGIISLSNNAGTSLVQLSGPAYSDDDRLTSWSIYSVTSFMTFAPSLAYIVSNFPSFNGLDAIPVNTPVVNPSDGRFNTGTYKYTCLDGGIYFFSMSVGVAAGAIAQVQLQIDDPFTSLEMFRQSTTPNGLTTLSRNMLVRCENGGQVSINLVNGVVSQGTAAENLISFIGFRYGLANTATFAAWSFYTGSSWTASSNNIDPFQINIPLIDPSGIGFSSFSSTVTIFTRGYYYLYLSAGVQPNQPCRLSIRKADNSVVFAIRRTSNNQNGLDTIGHGAVVQLDANDQLRIVADAFTSGYSTTDGAHTSFFGMLIQPY